VGVRYIGSKARVAQTLASLVGDPGEGRFVDAFSGTGCVAAAAADMGWSVVVNDLLPSAISMSIGALVGAGNVRFENLGGYQDAVKRLNNVPSEAGFIHAEYSPASRRRAGVERRYFTEENAARIDAMRSQIRLWSGGGLLSRFEEELLLADLMQAANHVANIAGTYGCFLRHWTTQALRPIFVAPRELHARRTSMEAIVGDVSTLETVAADVLYLDPPYTKRQYGAYYHILETIHAGDVPQVFGVTGLRPWQDKASEFCYKTKALDALTKLVTRTRANRILLSYSNEGHVPQTRLIAALEQFGHVIIHNVAPIGRYRPNARASATASTVNEFVVEVTRDSAKQAARTTAVFACV
jgi:adenine-specific DNA-methyltransferase